MCYADETEIDCERRNDIFWCAVDWGTRYINATLYSPKIQNVEDAIEFLKKTTKYGKPKFIQTDAATFYPKAMTRLFFSNRVTGKGWHNKLTTEHRVINTARTGKYNVRIETVFMKIKDRVDDFRGLKALWSAPILLQGIIIQHNFIEAHTTTGKVPSELANIKLGLGVNRWLGLIKLSVD